MKTAPPVVRCPSLPIAGSWRRAPSPGIGLMVVGLIQENREFECGGLAQSRALYAQSTQRRFSRWFHNGRIQAYRSYAPLTVEF